MRKTRTALWIELHPPLAEAVEAALRHRRFRDSKVVAVYESLV